MSSLWNFSALSIIGYISWQVGPMTQGMPFLMTPDFSAAICSTVSPITSMWSRPIDVIAEQTGLSTIFVASNFPPIPHSRTAY